jgi:hypothetical protein
VSGQDVRGLLMALEAAGVRLTLNAAGDGLTLSGKGRPPAQLLEAVRACKPALLGALRPVKADPPPSLPSPEDRPAVGPLSDSERGRARPLPDWGAIAAQPGHCGSCARWELAPDWGAFMGTCGCPPGAWPGNLPPHAIHAGHRCAAYREEGQAVGRGYRAKGDGKRYSPRPDMRPQPAQVAP